MAGRKPKMLLSDVAKVRGLKTQKRTRSTKKKATTIDEIFDRIIEEGAEKYIQELMSLSGKDFVSHFNAIMEYIKPKLARTENIGDNAERAITINMISGSTDMAQYQIESNMSKGEEEMILLD